MGHLHTSQCMTTYLKRHTETKPNSNICHACVHFCATSNGDKHRRLQFVCKTVCRTFRKDVVKMTLKLLFYCHYCWNNILIFVFLYIHFVTLPAGVVCMKYSFNYENPYLSAKGFGGGVSLAVAVEEAHLFIFP